MSMEKGGQDIQNKKKKTEVIVVDKLVRQWLNGRFESGRWKKYREILIWKQRKSMKGTFNQYHIVYSPIRRTAPDSLNICSGTAEEILSQNEKNKVHQDRSEMIIEIEFTHRRGITQCKDYLNDIKQIYRTGNWKRWNSLTFHRYIIFMIRF